MKYEPRAQPASELPRVGDLSAEPRIQSQIYIEKT